MGTTHSATSPVCLTVPYHPSISYSSLRSESKWQRQPPVTMQVAVVATSSYRPSTDESIRPSMEKIEACVRWAAQHVRPSMDESIRELMIDSWLDSGFEIKDGWGFDIKWNPQNRVFRALVLEAEPKRKKSEEGLGPLYQKVDGGRGYATHGYMCTICPQTKYAYQAGMANHLWLVHTTNQYERFKCRTCNEHFSSKQSSENHLAADHAELLESLCNKEGDGKTCWRLLKRPAKLVNSDIPVPQHPLHTRGRLSSPDLALVQSPAIQRPNHATRVSSPQLFSDRIQSPAIQRPNHAMPSEEDSEDVLKLRHTQRSEFADVIANKNLMNVRGEVSPVGPWDIGRQAYYEHDMPPICLTEILNSHDMLPGVSTEKSRRDCLFDTYEERNGYEAHWHKI